MAERGKIFKDAPVIAPHRSWFDMSYENTFSMNIGECVPAAFFECLPGDHIKAKTSSLTRFAPMIAPVLTSVNQFSYHMYVRLRDIWTQFDKFITNNDQRKTWQQQTSFVPPTMPYFKPRRLLYDELNSVNNYQIGANPLQDNVTSYLALAGEGRSYRLVVRKWYDIDDNPHADYKIVTSDAAISLRDFDTDQTYDRVLYLIVDFKANTTEFDFNKDWLTSMNPFCPGSLLDYLGMDMSGVYKFQREWFNNAFTEINMHDILSIFDEENLGDVTEGTDNNFTPDDFKYQRNGGFSSLRNFFDTHAIVKVNVFTYADGCGGVSVKGDYRTYDRLNNTYDSGALTIPTFLVEEDPLSVLPIRAYRFIYDEYFRDQNYIEVNPITDFTRDGYEFADVDFSNLNECEDVMRYITTFRKAWEHDPYTTALPGPQRGDAVHFLPSELDTGTFRLKTIGSNTNVSGATAIYRSLGEGNGIYELGALNGQNAYRVEFQGSSFDLSAATIENFRWANAMQRYLEKKARTGGRYYEYLLGIWNKSVDDSKLNRPIYINGDRTPIQVSEVLQTSASDFQTDQPLGDMAGRAIALGKDEFIDYECPDYGFFIELTAVIPRVAYQQGVAPWFTKENYLDYPLPDFAQLGEEYVKQKELYYSADSQKDNIAFGYQSRYYQYKYRRSEIHGEFKDTLDFWHFGRKFDSAPVNGKKFIEVNPDYRQFAVNTPNYQHVYCQMWHDVQMNRALPEYGVPVL